MGQQPEGTMNVPGGNAGDGPPSTIYLIRHGEKPPDPPAATTDQKAPPPGPPFGVDSDGNENPHSLIPRGWQRSGALTVLFDPTLGVLQAGLQTPTSLISPTYGDAATTSSHRTYETILGLAQRLGRPIGTPYAEGQEAELAEALVDGYAGVVLVCWEHEHIPAIATALPVGDGSEIPPAWPGSRFDVIWAFDVVAGADPPVYEFSQIPQQVLSGDLDTVI
jgi:hypothetical protein